MWQGTAGGGGARRVPRRVSLGRESELIARDGELNSWADVDRQPLQVPGASSGLC